MYQLSDPVWIGWIRGDYGYLRKKTQLLQSRNVLWLSKFLVQCVISGHIFVKFAYFGSGVLGVQSTEEQNGCFTIQTFERPELL